MSTEQERLKRRGERILAVIQEIRTKHREVNKLLSVLQMQAEVLCQGIDPEEVDRYGFDPKLGKSRLAANAAVYNYVIRKDGSRQDIRPVLRPYSHGGA